MLAETSGAGAPFPHCGAAHGASGGPRAGPEHVVRLRAHMHMCTCTSLRNDVHVHVVCAGMFVSAPRTLWAKGFGYGLPTKPIGKVS